MLDLLNTYTGVPTSGLQHLVLPHETLLLYPSADSVIILNARTLSFVRALAFQEIFPGTLQWHTFVKCLTIDPGMKLVVASMGARVAAWSLSGVKHDTWRVHSSLILDPKSLHVTTLDCKSGLLAVGTQSSLSVYTLILENDLPTWSLKWSSSVGNLSRVRFSPSLMYIASSSSRDNVVRIYLTTSGRQTQSIPHPRPITDLRWRNSQASSRDDLILYTITSDATLRVFLPILDAPQHVQLHAALDLFSSLPYPIAAQSASSRVFWLDKAVMLAALDASLSSVTSKTDDARSRRIQEIKEEGWDLFLRILDDGSVVIRAVANIDRRPPTLLKQFTLLQSPPGTLPHLPTHLYVLPHPDTGTLTLVVTPPLTAYELTPPQFFDAREDGLRLLSHFSEQPEERVDERRGVIRFVRTPNGEGVAVLRAGGGDTWGVTDRGTQLVRRGIWKSDTGVGTVDLVVVLDKGYLFVTYTAATRTLTLHTPTPTTLTIPSIDSLFLLPSPGLSSHPSLVGITPSHSILIINVTLSPSSLTLYSHTSLPLAEPPKFILPVDPMAWSNETLDANPGAAGNGEPHDVLLSVSAEGELAFWVPEIGTNVRVKEAAWRCTGRVRTGLTGFSMATCSSMKKSALVVRGSGQEELTIWDSKESEFSSGLEYRHILSSSDPISDLDWTSTPDNQSILAVGFAHHVELLSQQRMSYFDEASGWGICYKIELGNMISYPISDSIWLARGSLLIGAGHIMCLYGQRPQDTTEKYPTESFFEHVARHNGPLEDYHPQMILQCLLWGKVELVKAIIVNLAKNLERTLEIHEWQSVPIDAFLKKDDFSMTFRSRMQHKPQYSLLFSVPEIKEESDEDQFSQSLVHRLIEKLEEHPLPHFTPNEQASLLVLIQATLEIEEQRRALDANGLRYLISMRTFYLFNRRTSSPSSPASNGAISVQKQRRERLRYRDIIWAFHSESQELLLSTSVAACDGKMRWPDARALGVFLWLRPGETMKVHIEALARNQYMAGNTRDPTQCSLFYFALGKHKLVHGLWRQAAWHPEQSVMLKFLGNDFSEPRWRTAALKNAFALLSKRRFEYAASFFLLGGSLKDAVNVCIRNLSDFQLAVALARVVEQGDDGPVLKDILNNTVVPIAFKDGNRWLASWAFWLLHRRDLAVRILVTPLQDIAALLDIRITDIGHPHYDDPSLALLFSDLKEKTLQAAKGTSEISGRLEFNFVLQIARVFCRMGCHALALDLVRSWSFLRPSVVVHESNPSQPPSPISARFTLSPAMRRRSSIMIDMELPSAPPTRSASPVYDATQGTSTTGVQEALKEEGDLVARKAGLGSLIKSAKQDVKVPEFDMGAFF